jgi:hypothetical protein
MSDGGVVGALGLFGDEQGVFQDLIKLGWDGIPCASSGAIEAHEIGLRLPWTHLRDDLIQLLLDAPGEIAVHLTNAHHGFDTPRRAHAEAGRLEPACVVWQGGWFMPLDRQQNPPLVMRRA